MTPAALGWLGQALFAMRFGVQWYASERVGRSVVPAAFWWLSLGGALLLAAYSAGVREPVLCGGYLASAWIYARSARPAAPERACGAALELAAVTALLAASWVAGILEARDEQRSAAWLVVLLIGQAIWNGRFAWHWWTCRRDGVMHFSDAFWWWSLAANTLLLAYALHRRDPLLVCAFAFGPLVQARNLVLALRAHSAGAIRS